jgi:hypothetical protein
MSNKTLPVVTDEFTPGALSERPSTLQTLRSKAGLSANLPEVLGALAIGILVIGGGVGIAAGINYSRDAQAKSTLKSIATAETLVQSKTDSFGSLDDLTSGDTPALAEKPDATTTKIAQTDTNYCAVIKSKSMTGPTYWITAKDGAVLTTAPTDAEAGIACPTL